MSDPEAPSGPPCPWPKGDRSPGLVAINEHAWRERVAGATGRDALAAENARLREAAKVSAEAEAERERALRRSVEVTVFRGDRVLGIRTTRYGGGFFGVGGKVEPGESFEDAARRELREETGCEAVSLRFVAGHTLDALPQDPEPGAWYCAGFVADIGAQEPRKCEPHTEPFWTTRESMARESLFPEWYSWWFGVLAAESRAAALEAALAATEAEVARLPQVLTSSVSVKQRIDDALGLLTQRETDRDCAEAGREAAESALKAEQSRGHALWQESRSNERRARDELAKAESALKAERERAERLERERDNYLTFGQGGASYTDAQWIDKMATANQIVAKTINALAAERDSERERAERAEAEARVTVGLLSVLQQRLAAASLCAEQRGEALQCLLLLARDKEWAGRTMHVTWCATKRSQGFHGPNEPCPAKTPDCPGYWSGGRWFQRCSVYHGDLIPWEKLHKDQQEINRHAFDAIIASVERIAKDAVSSSPTSALGKALIGLVEAALGYESEIGKDEERYALSWFVKQVGVYRAALRSAAPAQSAIGPFADHGYYGKQGDPAPSKRGGGNG